MLRYTSGVAVVACLLCVSFTQAVPAPDKETLSEKYSEKFQAAKEKAIAFREKLSTYYAESSEARDSVACIAAIQKIGTDITNLAKEVVNIGLVRPDLLKSIITCATSGSSANIPACLTSAVSGEEAKIQAALKDIQQNIQDIGASLQQIPAQCVTAPGGTTG